MSQKIKPGSEPMLIEWLIKLLLIVVSVLVVMGIFTVAAAVAGICSLTELTSTFGQTGGAIVLAAMVISVGLIVGILINTLKK